MKTNLQVVTAFVNGDGARSGSMQSFCGRLYSYNTLIAEWKDDEIFVNTTKYSRTTSKQQSLLERALTKTCSKVFRTTNPVPLNTLYDLYRYL